MKRITLAAAAAVCLLFSVTGCAKKDTAQELPVAPVAEVTEEPKLVTWYGFTQNGFSEIETPGDAPRVPFRPWTEALRVSSAAETGTSQEYAPYFLVNRLGLMTFTPEPVLYSDVLVFSDSTADSIVSIENIPVVHLYKSSYFNPNTGMGEQPFLVQFEKDTGEFIPLLGTADLGLSSQAQSIDLFYTGTKWVSAFKTVSDNRTEFEYLTFTSEQPLPLMLPADRAAAVKKTSISADDYKRAQMPRPVTQAPERLRTLLSAIPEDVPYQVSCRFAEGTGNMTFTHGSDTEGGYAEAKVLYGNTWTAALFSDGTFFFEGALPGRSLSNGGKPVSLRLPRLPAGFVYTHFIISGTSLQAAWEEESFFETGRSGFLTASLGALL